MPEDPAKNPPTCRLVFARLVSRPEPAIDLAEAAFLIAKEEYPDLDIAQYLSHLDAMAADVRSRPGGVEDPLRLFTGLGDYLFREQGFRGNTEDYYDPRNSFLNEVLDRRTGIPITLSAVYMEVGRRLGLRLHGVGMPGHFLVKYVGPNEEIIVDPFHGGAIVSPADCQRILDPHAANEVRDRGLLCCQLRRYPEAVADLEQYLKLAPGVEDAEVIRDHLRFIRQRAASMN